MRKLTHSLMLGGSAAVLLAATASAGFAQDLPIEQVVVTGTSIRGVAPIGSNLLSPSINPSSSPRARRMSRS